MSSRKPVKVMTFGKPYSAQASMASRILPMHISWYFGLFIPLSNQWLLAMAQTRPWRRRVEGTRPLRARHQEERCLPPSPARGEGRGGGSETEDALTRSRPAVGPVMAADGLDGVPPAAEGLAAPGLIPVGLEDLAAGLQQ